MKFASVFALLGVGLALVPGMPAAGTAAPTAAQEPKEPAAGQKGQLIPSPFRSYIVMDDRFPAKPPGSTNADDRDPKDRTNKMHCLICENGLNPVAAIFVREDAKKFTASSGLAKLALGLNALMVQPEYRGAKLGAFVIFMKVEGQPKSVTVANPDKSQTTLDLDAEYPDDEMRDRYAGDIQQLAKDIKEAVPPKDRVQGLQVVFGLAPAAATAAKAWGIADTDEVTVIVYNHIRIANRWTFKAETGPTEAEVKQIIAAVVESVTGEKKP